MGSSTTLSSNSTITTTTTTSSSSSTTTTTTSPFHLLEITIISAQDLTPVTKSMRTYAVVWVQPERKLVTCVDPRGHANPTWNDKFMFRIDDDFLNSDTSAVMVEIYTVSWFRDTLVGNVKVLINNLIPPSTRVQNNFSTRFVALQVRRASGSPQGILNMAVSLLDSSTRSMPIPKLLNLDDQANPKIQLCRSRSEKSDVVFEAGSNCNTGSIINGSVVNDSELCSDVGPSASIVAAAIAKGVYPARPPPATSPEQNGGVLTTAQAEDQERGSSILEDLTVEEATAKGYKSRPAAAAAGVDQSFRNSDGLRHSRRHSSAGPGLFSCFAYGFEFTIVCGTKKDGRNKDAGSIDKPMIKRSPSHQNLSF